MENEIKQAALDYANKELIRAGITDENTPKELACIIASLMVNSFKAGAQWQKEQMMKDATDVIVYVDAGGYPYIPQIELYDYDKDEPLAKEGDKYKVVLIKEE